MNEKKYEKRSAYNAEKLNKRDNYTFLNTNYCEKGQTVLAGDSITEMYNHTELFAQYEKESGLHVYNRGISGDTSNRLLERFNDNVLNIEPRNIALLIGTNDIICGADDERIVTNIGKIINMTKEHCSNTNLVIIGVYPVNSTVNKQGKRNNARIAGLNEKIKHLCKENHIQYMNINSQLEDEYGNLSRGFTYDGLHLNAKAFEIVTKNLIQFLK